MLATRLAHSYNAVTVAIPRIHTTEVSEAALLIIELRK
jgi:hypothetical protein